MLIPVLTGFMGALVAPLLHRAAPRAAGWACALIPLGLCVYFASLAVPAATGIHYIVPWVPSLGVTLSFTLDGLSLLFALVISGIGSLILFYTSEYLEGHHHLGRMYAFLLAFMASMLGLVLAGNLLLLYVFWELTSITSYALIGFNHQEEKSRSAALQALLVTGAGGLSLLAGIVIIGSIGGTFEISRLMEQREVLVGHSLYLPALLLVLGGAFTKSAQVPFHFWLPSAMAAPTPVSAYLHSAAMVKAGLYLLARLTPVLGGTEAWQTIIIAVGAATMLTGAVISLTRNDLKLILAYSTVSALGMLTLLIGIGTQAAIQAFTVYLLVHVLYKGGLFLVAGAVDHATGTRDLNRLGALGRALPVVAVAAVLAALSMAGIPPSLGYIGKELLYEAQLHAPQAATLLTAAGVSANIFMVAVAVMAGVVPFFRGRADLPHEPHPVSWKLWLAPLTTGIAGFCLGIFPGLLEGTLLSPAAASIAAAPLGVHLKLWAGLNLPLILGIVTVAAGIAVYAARGKLLRLLPASVTIPGPERWYAGLLDGMLAVARRQTRLLQSGYLGVYLKLVLGAAVGMMALALLRNGQAPLLGEVKHVRLHEWAAGIMIVAGAVVAASTGSRLAAVAALGAVGYGVSLVYLLFGAPDLAITQFCIETLSVTLFVLVLYRLPHFSSLSGKASRARDILIALTGGIMMTLLTLLALSQPLQSRISGFFAENSKTLAHGRNVVNVILVDFRGLDTLGEITVLSIAAIGIYGLIKLSIEPGGGEEKEEK